MTTIEKPTVEELRSAARVLEGVARRTPLVPLHSRDDDLDIELKLEIHQPAGCFKIRGVFHAVSRFTEEERARGISTVSAGNTAKALAWCGRHFGVAARSVMPDHAPRTKIDAVRAYGGEPVLVPIDEVFRYMKEHGWDDEPYAFVHPWTERNVLIGHGTIGLEILEQCPDVETVFVPVGGGGLLGGVGSALRLLKPSVRIVAVEPEGCPSLHAAIEAGEPVDVDSDTMCDGVAVPYVTHEMFPLLSELADRVQLVSEDEVKSEIRRLASGNHIIAEGSGALASAAARAVPREERGKTVCIVTGGSIDTAKLVSILAADA